MCGQAQSLAVSLSGPRGVVIGAFGRIGEAARPSKMRKKQHIPSKPRLYWALKGVTSFKTRNVDLAITRRDLLLTGTAAAALPALGSATGVIGTAAAQSASELTSTGLPWR